MVNPLQPVLSLQAKNTHSNKPLTSVRFARLRPTATGLSLSLFPSFPNSRQTSGSILRDYLWKIGCIYVYIYIHPQTDTDTNTHTHTHTHIIYWLSKSLYHWYAMFTFHKDSYYSLMKCTIRHGISDNRWKVSFLKLISSVAWKK